MDVTGRHIVVTGAASGIGAALAARFHAAGARLSVADLDGAGAEAVAGRLNVTRPRSAVGLQVDVATEAGNVELIGSASEALGPIDLFFANAGILGGGGLDTSESDWNAAFAVNVHAHRWAAKHLVPGWLTRGEGYFCSTASAAGLLTQIGAAPYSVTKHAAVAFAEWLAITYGDRGVKVSCLCPQGVNTPMLRAAAERRDPTVSRVVLSGGPVLEPLAVADEVLAAIAAERFLITPHPEVLGYWARKVGDYDRWLSGMRKLQRRAQES